MPVKNLTRNSLIALRSRVADSTLKRTVGLMFSLQTDSAMILKFERDTSISLHTFFVFFPIDIIFVGSSGKVVEIVEGMAPFTAYSARKKAKYVVELPNGSVRKSRTRVGDSIAFLRIVEKKTRNGRSIAVSHSLKV